MSVDLKRGWFISEFYGWQNENSKIENPENRIQLIKEFLESKRIPKRIRDLINSIKEIKDWFSYIKEDNQILLEKLFPKPTQEDFKKAIREIKKLEEFKTIYKEHYRT